MRRTFDQRILLFDQMQPFGVIAMTIYRTHGAL